MRPSRRHFSLLCSLCILAPLLLSAVDPAARAQASFDRRAMLQSIVDHVILPSQAAFLQASQHLSAAAEQFASAPDAGNLTAFHAAWRDASDAWDEIAIFNMDLRLTSVHNQVYKPPANYAFIDDLLAGDDELSEAYVNGIGSTSKGLDAIEYLAFAPDKSGDEISATFSQPRRRQFLLALAQNVERKASEIQRYWSPAGRDYAAGFVKADQEGGVLQGAINMLANKMFNALQTDLEMWLGEPAGITLEGGPQPDLVESPFARHSLSHIAHRLTGLRKLFNGGADDAHLGFDDYLDFLGADSDGGALSDAINARFEAALASIDDFDRPLAIAVSDSPENVATLFENMRQLLIPLRADMKSHLSILITLSDRDGDQ